MNKLASFDKEAALAEIARYLDTAPITKEVGDTLKLDWKEAWKPKNIVKTSRELWDVVQAVAAAVEVFKTRWAEEHGKPLTGDDAADLAVSVLDAWILWEGWPGKLLEAVDAKILRMVLEFVLHGRRGVSWLAEAKLLVGLV